jgi:hypothetical protein
MTKPLQLLLLSLVLSILAGCDKGNSVNLVDAEKRSNSFDAVAAKLDLGGEVYNYMDTEGLVEAITTAMADFIRNMQASPGNHMEPGLMVAAQLPALSKHLGLLGIDAIGTSAYRDGDHYHAKSYLYQPNGRAGLFTLTGDTAHEFRLLSYAPANTDYFYSCDLTLSRIYPIAKAIMADVMGEMGSSMLETQLSQPLPELNITGKELIAQLDTEAALIVSLGESMLSPAAGPSGQKFPVPQINATLILSNMVELFEQMLQTPSAADSLKKTQSGSLSFYSMPERSDNFPIGPGAALIATDTETGMVYLSTSRDTLDACLEKSNGLAHSTNYTAATKGLPSQGNMLNYISTNVYKIIKQSTQEAARISPEVAGGLNLYSLFVPILGAQGTEPASATVGVNEPQGTWFVANTPFRPSGGAGAEAQAPIIAGLMASMAIPAFQKVRTNSQQKAITNNLRQFASGGMQYMLEEGKNQATYTDVVGETKYVRQLKPVNGEDYTQLIVHSEGGELSVTMQNDTVVSYQY